MTDSNLQRHQRIAKRAEDVSMIVGILSTLISIGATLLEPSGLTAFAIFVGLSDPPLIVTLAPIIAHIATMLALFSGGCFIYAKLKG